MNGQTKDASFPLNLPDVENIYELVVSAALRARQLNRFPHLRDGGSGENIVDQALREAVEGKIRYAIEEPGPEEAEEEPGEA